MASVRAIIVCLAVIISILIVVTLYNHFGIPHFLQCMGGTTLSFVAHEDDDLLFLNPDIAKSILAGKCTITVFVTAGDAGVDASYWKNRELGSKAAYAALAKLPNEWIGSKLSINSFEIYSYELSSNRRVKLIFMRLPDGNIDGSGFPSNNFESLQKMWEGKIAKIYSVDTKQAYTYNDIVQVLTYLMTFYKPDHVYTEDYLGKYGDLDHSDHHSVAYFVKKADQNYHKKHLLVGFMGYRSAGLSANLDKSDIEIKEMAFIDYAKHDPYVCQTIDGCNSSGISMFFAREYLVDQGTSLSD